MSAQQRKSAQGEARTGLGRRRSAASVRMCRQLAHGVWPHLAGGARALALAASEAPSLPPTLLGPVVRRFLQGDI